MKLKLKLLGNVEVKVRTKILWFWVVKNFKTNLNQTVDLGSVPDLNGFSRVVGVPGPADLLFETEADGDNVTATISVVLDGTHFPLFSQSRTVKKSNLNVNLWNIKMDNVRGVTCDLTINLEAS